MFEDLSADIQNVDFDELSSNAGDQVSDLSSNIDFEQLGELSANVGDFLKPVVEGLSALI